MARKFDDLDQYWSPGLTLTVLGREYEIPLPSAELGLWCRRVAQVAGDVHTASTEQEMQAAIECVNALPELPGDLSLPERVLGEVYAQMAADGVSDLHIQFCAATAYIWIIADEDTAARYWTSGGRPEASGPANRSERRAHTGRNSTGEADATNTPVSTSGTTSRPRSRRSRKGSGSRGKRS